MSELGSALGTRDGKLLGGAGMTDREKLIELMRQVDACICNLCDGSEEAFDHSAGILADHLIANGVTFATDNNVGGKWIPVTERLPDRNCRVAVLYRFPRSKVPFSTVFDYYATDPEPHFQHTLGEGGPIVTHWMPLPAPPKEGE